MRPRGRVGGSLLPLVVLAFGCSSGGAAKPDAGGSPSHDADFSVCSGTPAMPYTPGLSVLSASGAYRATVTSASTADSSGATAPTAAIGLATFAVAITTAGEAGAGAAATGVAMTIPPSPAQVPADPYMPVHKHGASTSPLITDQSGGLFGVSNVDFFMGGFWELYLDLTPAGAATADRVTFQICIPND